jgi:ABC-type transport system involved in cytochrome c biogenesis permease subunit
LRHWIHRLASMRIAISLLVIIVIALAAGTIIESFQGTDVAARSVYYAPWFHLLLGFFALNVLCSLVDHWPWGWDRAGFALTHGSMLIILAGALVTNVFKIDGHLALWEGEESARFERGTGAGAPPEFATLPFSVRLDSFEIDTYPGTQRPAMFRSRVTVKDAGEGRTFPAVIEMNRELSYRGYRLFQSSYQRAPGKDRTILAVSKDPGQGIVFAGYALLMAGMLTVLGTRIAQRRAMTRQLRTLAAKPSRRAASALMGILALAVLPARAATVPDTGSVERLRALPVQHDGRVMPLDTLAREATWKVTGSHVWEGMDPVALVLWWSLDPAGWSSQPVVSLGDGSLAGTLGLPAGTRHASFQTLVGSGQMMTLIHQARSFQEQERPVHGLLKEAEKVDERLAWMQGFLDHSVLRVLPQASDPGAPWEVPDSLRSTGDLLAVLQAGSPAWPAPDAMAREVAYNRVRPSRLAWWVLSAAALLSLLAWNLRRRWLDFLAVAGLLAGFGVMTWGLAVRWQVAGRIPASNMYESMLFLGWGVALFALVAVVFLRNRLVIFNATAMAALAMILADCLPVDPFIHPVPPVLAGTVWLAIHVPIIMVSYSVLALGVLVAHMQVGLGIFAPNRRRLSATMSDLLYWYILVGSILLIAGILTGSIWASSSWGRYWGWDPKEVWSLIAFLAYLAILHGRFERYLGPFGVAAISIIAFWTIIMTYVGVNFVLASGLHSYGFGSSAVVRWLLIVAAAEALFLGAGAFADLSRGGKSKGTELPV